MIDSQAFNIQFSNAAIHKKPLKLEKTYLLYGQTPFLSEENASIIVAVAKQHGFAQREIFYIDNRTHFQTIIDSLQSPGLFDPKKIVELRFETEKPTKKIGENIATIAKHTSENLVIIQAGNLPYRVQKETWFKSLQQSTTAVVAKRIYPNQLANWIGQRAIHMGIELSSGALQMIMRYSEGNLLWSNQILMQLVHSDYPRPIDESTISSMLSDLSVFHIEDLTTALFSKNHDALRIVNKLENENESLVYITTVLYRELDTVRRIILSGKPFSQACQDLRIWQNKQRQYKNALNHYDLRSITDSLSQLAQLDRINKGQHKGDGWLLLTNIVSTMVL